MRNIRIIVAYDGTDLAGYQKQPDDKGLTVQGCLEYGLSKICNEPIQIYGASRTDAGVHAKFQVCTFQTSGSIPAENIPRAMIAHIPKDIVVLEAVEIPLYWKPRWNIYGKEYVYTIHNQLIANPLTKRYHWHVKKPLNIELMQDAGNELLGTHDFTTLKGTNSTPADPVKTIMGIHVEGKGPHVTISWDFFANCSAIASLNSLVSKPRSATDIPSATILRINIEPCFIAVSEIGKDKQLIFVSSYLEKSGFTLLSQMM